MKYFLKNVLKALCYLALYIAAQNVAAYIVLFYAAFRMILQDPALVQSEAGLDALLSRLYDAVYLRTDLILLISAVITFLTLLIFFRARGKRLTREAWLLPVQIRSLWPVVLAGAALAVVVGYGISYIPWPAQVIEAYEESYAATNGDGGLLMVLVSVLAAPFLEELIFRGLVFTRLCRGMPAPAAVILAATIFAAVHGTILWAAYAFVGGIAMTLVFMKYRSLCASMVMHAVFNLFGGYVLGWLEFPSPVYDLALFGAALAGLALLGRYMARLPRSRIDFPLRPFRNGD